MEIVGQQSSDNKEFTMTEREATEIDIPDIESNNELEEEAKEETPGHPETIIAMPAVVLGSKKMKTLPCLLDMCATSSFMDPKFFDEFLGVQRDGRILGSKPKSVDHSANSWQVLISCQSKRMASILTKSSRGWQTCIDLRCTLILRRTSSSGQTSVCP
eukprot:13674473-Ditylum_brightwellii.AAC.1